MLALCTDLAVLWAQYSKGGAYATPGFYRSDLLRWYHAAERLRDGGNPYVIRGEFLHPPTFLLLVRAALFVPYLALRVLWSLASVAMLLGGAWCAARALHWRPGARVRALAALALLLYTPTVLLVPLAANSTAPVVLCYGLALLLFTRGHEGRAGVVLCLAALVKPQLAFIGLPLLLYKRRWRAALAYLATGAFGLGLSLLLLGPVTFREFLEMARVTADRAATLRLWINDNPSMHGLILSIWPRGPAEQAVAYGLSLALLLWLAWYWRGPWQPWSARFAAGWASVPIVDLLATPYAHSDDMVVLAVPAVVLYALGRHGGVTARQRAQTGVVLATLYLAPVLVIYSRLHVMVPALLAALWVLAQLPAASEVLERPLLRIPRANSRGSGVAAASPGSLDVPYAACAGDVPSVPNTTMLPPGLGPGSAAYT